MAEIKNLGEILVERKLLKPEQLEKETGKRYSLQVEREEIFKSLEKTTVAGKTLLFQALNGQFPYFLLKLADQMAQTSCLDWAMKAFAETTRHGETSGTDASVGLVWFLDYFKGNN